MAGKRIRNLEGVKNRNDFFQVDPRQIVVNPGWNPRLNFAEEELKDSIIENGVLVPLRVKRNPDDTIVLIDGERRLRATLRAIEEGHEINTVPCIFERPQISESEAMFVTLVTNQGKPLDPTEEAEAFQRLVNWGQTTGDIARRIGKSLEFVRQRLALVDASPQVKAAVQQGRTAVKDAVKIVKQSGGNIEAQNQALTNTRTKGQTRTRRTTKQIILDKAAGLKRDDIEDLIEQLKSMLDGGETMNYSDPQSGRKFEVAAGLGGKEFGLFERKPNGSLRRIKQIPMSPNLDEITTRAALYAQKKGWNNETRSF